VLASLQPQSGSRCDEGALDARWEGHIARWDADASAKCQLAKGNRAERRPSMVSDDLGPPSDLP
jgi:hypothetical protein